jgi:acetoin utilization protein AcuB
MPIVDALNLMKREHIRRAPVVKAGRLLGIVADKDLLNASASPATSLSVWELNYLISKITVREVMTEKVLTVTEDTPIEEAARIMVTTRSVVCLCYAATVSSESLPRLIYSKFSLS